MIFGANDMVNIFSRIALAQRENQQRAAQNNQQRGIWGMVKSFATSGSNESILWCPSLHFFSLDL